MPVVTTINRFSPYYLAAAPRSTPFPSLRFASLMLPNRAPVIASLRKDQEGNDHVECVYEASCAVANAGGQVLIQFGDDEYFPVMTRSAIKPLNAAMLLDAMEETKRKGQEVPELTPEEWAVLCASHAGTDEHVEKVRAVMDKFGIQESNLVTGTHPPLDAETRNRLIREGKEPTALRHQCSGHHTGLNALAKLKGFPPEDYSNPEGQLQQFLLNDLQGKAGDPYIKLIKADGCNIPTWSVPMSTLATLYARLIDDPKYKPIVDAMTGNPDLVGDLNRIDSWLMKVTQGRLIAKIGSDGLICVARKPQEEGQQAQGLVFKLWQGNVNEDPMRDRTVIQTLFELGWLTENEVNVLRERPQFALTQTVVAGAMKDEQKVEFRIFPFPWAKSKLMQAIEDQWTAYYQQAREELMALQIMQRLNEAWAFFGLDRLLPGSRKAA